MTVSPVTPDMAGLAALSPAAIPVEGPRHRLRRKTAVTDARAQLGSEPVLSPPSVEHVPRVTHRRPHLLPH